MMGAKKRQEDYPFYQIKGMFKVNYAVKRLAERRVGALCEFSEVAFTPLIELLANAYLIGVKDAVENLSDGC